MSLTGREILDMTFEVATGETITGYQVVKIDDSDSLRYDAKRVKVCTDPSGYPVGVAQNDDYNTLTAGDPVTVRIRGISKVISNTHTNISAGDTVSPGAAGRVDVATATRETWNLGVAITRGEQLFDELLVLVDPFKYYDS